MKTLLYYPACLESRIHTDDVEAVPIGLYFIGAVLKSAGHPVDIINGYHLGDDETAFLNLLKTHRPALLGVSILNANRWGGIKAAGIAKRFDPSIVTVFGGVGATFLQNHLLTHFEDIDYIVPGEGEHAILGLVEHLESTACDQEPLHIPGIAMRKGNNIHFTGNAAFIDDLDALPDPSEYFTYNHLALTRGCGADCRFCGSPAIWGRRIRSHSADYFVRQLERLHRRGVTFFFVADDTFTCNKKTVVAACRLIVEKQLQITWAAIARVDQVDNRTLSWMRRAGCIQISYGVESGSRSIRRYLNKNFRDKDIEKAFQRTTRWGILPRAYFIYGCPAESDKTIAETLALIAVIRPLAAIFYILDIFPGTAIYDAHLEKTGESDDIWLQEIEDIMYYETDPQLSEARVREFGRQLRDGFHRMLPGFVADIDLEDDPQWYPFHADFLSRLGLTFSHGDYSGGQISRADEIAEGLFRRAIDYHPDARAYLGLGMLRQRVKDFEGAIRILLQGVAHFPKDQQIRTCLGVCQLNAGRYGSALKSLLPLAADACVHPYIAACYRALGNPKQAQKYQQSSQTT